ALRRPCPLDHPAVGGPTRAAAADRSDGACDRWTTSSLHLWGRAGWGSDRSRPGAGGGGPAHPASVDDGADQRFHDARRLAAAAERAGHPSRGRRRLDHRSPRGRDPGRRGRDLRGPREWRADPRRYRSRASTGALPGGGGGAACDHARRPPPSAGRRGRDEHRRGARAPAGGVYQTARSPAFGTPGAGGRMSFQSPWLLLGLLAIPLLVGLYIASQQRRRAYAVRFTNLALLNQVMGKGPGFRRHLPAILFIAGVAGLLLSMARPQASIRVPKGQTSVMLAVDVSGSMAATDVQPTRIAAAIAAGRTLIDKLPANAQVGLVIFNSQ